ncbi:hypothetical protein Lal_00014758 [Lupinus albus]|nr:hypothetical protein Lal_00014758 [Lupinus albus]
MGAPSATVQAMLPIRLAVFADCVYVPLLYCCPPAPPRLGARDVLQGRRRQRHPRRHRRPVVRPVRPRAAEDRRRRQRDGRPARFRAHVPDGPPGRVRPGRTADGLHEPQVRPRVLHQLRLGIRRHRPEDRARLPQGARRCGPHPADRARAGLPRRGLRRPVRRRHRPEPQGLRPAAAGRGPPAAHAQPRQERVHARRAGTWRRAGRRTGTHRRAARCIDHRRRDRGTGGRIDGRADPAEGLPEAPARTVHEARHPADLRRSDHGLRPPDDAVRRRLFRRRAGHDDDGERPHQRHRADGRRVLEKIHPRRVHGRAGRHRTVPRLHVFRPPARVRRVDRDPGRVPRAGHPGTRAGPATVLGRRRAQPARPAARDRHPHHRPRRRHRTGRHPRQGGRARVRRVQAGVRGRHPDPRDGRHHRAVAAARAGEKTHRRIRRALRRRLQPGAGRALRPRGAGQRRRRERRRGRGERRVPRLGRDAAAGPRPRAVQLPAAVPAPHGRLRGDGRARAWQDVRGRARRSRARHRSRGIRRGHSADAEGRVHGPDRARHRRVVDAPAAGRRRGHHAIQLPRDGADVDVPRRHRMRQHVRSETVRTRSVAVAAACAAAEGSGAAGRRVQRRAGRQGRRGRAAGPPGHRGRQLRRLDADRGVHLRPRQRGRQARAGPGRREEPHGRDAGRRHGHGRRRPGRRSVRLGGRALHGDLGGGGGRRRGRYARRAAGRTHPRPEDRGRHGGRRRDGPGRHAGGQAAHRKTDRRRRGAGRDARRRRPRLPGAGARQRFLRGRYPVRPRAAVHVDLPGRDLRPRAVRRAAAGRGQRAGTHQPQRVRQRRGRVHPRRRRGARIRAAGSRGHGGRERAAARADGVQQLRRVEEKPVRRPPCVRAGGGAVLYAPQGGDAAVAEYGRQRGGVRIPADEMTATHG